MTQAHNKNVPSHSTNRQSPRRSETKFYSEKRENVILLRRKGEKEDKRESACPFPFLFREREREERDSFVVVVVSLTSFTSSSPGHHP